MVFRLLVAWKDLEAESCDDLRHLVRIAACKIERRLSKIEEPILMVTYGFKATASYTAQILSNTNCTKSGFKERPRRCL